MPAQMIGHECRDEIIAMIIARLHPDRRGLTGGGTSLRQEVRLELTFKEIIGFSLINQQIRQARPACDECAGIIVRPSLPIFPEVAAERLLPPKGNEVGTQSARKPKSLCTGRDCAAKW